MKYDRKTLEQAGIYDLRLFAKQFGVYSPTTKKKAQIIEEILEIQEGNLAPVFGNRGRKNIDFFLSSKNETTYDYYKKLMSNDTDVLVKLNIKTIEDFIVYINDILSHSLNAKVVKINDYEYVINFYTETVHINLNQI